MRSRFYRRIRDFLPGEAISRHGRLMRKRWGFNLLQSKYLWKILSGESALALRLSANRSVKWLAALRISFLTKVVYALAGYMPARIKKRLSWKQKGQMLTVRPARLGTFYLCRYRDLLLVGNDRDFLTGTVRLIRDNKAAPVQLPSHFLRQTDKAQMLFHCDAKPVELYLRQDREARRIAARNPLVYRWLSGHCAKIYKCLAHAEWSNQKIDLRFQLMLRPDAGDFRQIVLPLDKDSVPGTLLPQKTFFYTRLAIPWKKVWKDLPRRSRNRIKDFLRQSGERESCIEELLSYFKSPTICLLTPINFIKENLNPLDPYPAVAFVAETDRPSRLFAEIEATLQRIRQRALGRRVQDVEKFFFTMEKYAGHKYIRFKFPDVSGDAIQPAIGVVGTYLVITTHNSLLKELIDVGDRIAPSLGRNPFYAKMQNVLSGDLSIFVDVDGIPDVLADLCRSSEFIKFLALHVHKPGTDFCLLQRKIKSDLLDLVTGIRAFKTGCVLDIRGQKQQIEGRLVMPLQIR